MRINHGIALLRCAALCTMLSFGSTANAQLVGYWNFDGSVEDLSGLENHGQLFDAEYSDNVPSVLGGGQSLDFSDDAHHVLIEADESLDSPTFTLAMFTYDRGQVGALERLTSRQGDTFETAINVHPPFEGMGEYAFFPGDGGWTWEDTIPTLEEWQHVAYVAREADTMEIYVGGELTFEGNWNGEPSGFMHIGNRHNDVEGFDGLIDNVALWNEALDEEAIRALAAGGSVLGNNELMPSPVGPQGSVGSNSLTAARANQVFSEPSADTSPGLGQSWYAVGNPGSKENIDVVFETNERAVPYFQAESGVTWWSGSNDVTDVPKYPTEVDGVITGDNYTVKLEGEILIEESNILFLDGVDDFTYLAIDVDRSGIAGDSEDDVLINDNSWTNALSTGNGGAPIVEADFGDVEDGGEWLAIEFNMGEGGGGDHGMLYWDAQDEDDFFPIDQGVGIEDIDAAIYMIPDTNLRSPAEPAQVISGDAVGTVPAREAGWAIDVNAADGTADTFVVENPDEAVLSTVLDVDGVQLSINAIGAVAEGDSFQILVADSIMGTPNIVTEGWSFDAATGSVVFGSAVLCDPNSMGDLDGNGSVDFTDFLVLSSNFGQAATDHTTGDIDCNGTVEFADFLAFSANFGQTVGAESVPEPSGLALLGFAGLLVGLVRRRRS